MLRKLKGIRTTEEKTPARQGIDYLIEEHESILKTGITLKEFSNDYLTAVKTLNNNSATSPTHPKT